LDLQYEGLLINDSEQHPIFNEFVGDLTNPSLTSSVQERKCKSNVLTDSVFLGKDNIKRIIIAILSDLNSFDSILGAQH
jgi:hypothetical protein